MSISQTVGGHVKKNKLTLRLSVALLTYHPHKKNFAMNRISSPRPNLDHLHTFKLVIANGSFSAAADLLGLTQPAVSLQIRQLEAFWKVKLVERVAKCMKPTQPGLLLLKYIARIEDVTDEAMRDMYEHSVEIRGRVTIGTGATACIHLLPTLLKDLKHDYPALDVNVRTGNTADMVKAVEENRLDLALVTLPAAGRNLAITPLCKQDFVLITSVQHNANPIQNIAKLPLVLFESGSSTRLLIDNWFLQQGLRPQPIMELGSIEAIKEMVIAGLGCSLIPRLAINESDLQRGVVMHALAQPLVRVLALVLRQDKPLNKSLKKVMDKLMLIR